MDVVKKALQFGFGLAYIGKTNAEALAKDLKKHYDLDEPQAKKMAKDIIRQSIDSQKKVRDMVEDHVYNLVDDLGVATRKDLEDMKDTVMRKTGLKSSSSSNSASKKKSSKKKRR